MFLSRRDSCADEKTGWQVIYVLQARKATGQIASPEHRVDLPESRRGDFGDYFDVHQGRRASAIRHALRQVLSIVRKPRR